MWQWPLKCAVFVHSYFVECKTCVKLRCICKWVYCVCVNKASLKPSWFQQLHIWQWVTLLYPAFRNSHLIHIASGYIAHPWDKSSLLLTDYSSSSSRQITAPFGIWMVGHGLSERLQCAALSGLSHTSCGGDRFVWRMLVWSVMWSDGGIMLNSGKPRS